MDDSGSKDGNIIHHSLHLTIPYYTSQCFCSLLLSPISQVCCNSNVLSSHMAQFVRTHVYANNKSLRIVHALTFMFTTYCYGFTCVLFM